MSADQASSVEDTALGPVEYATLGSGSPVLVVHGSPGGYDQALAMASFLPRDEFRAIVLSRPGYLGTELGDREAVDRQADLFAALLDHLGIERAGVLCWSGGGPSSYRLAARHPERVSGLVALAAVSSSFELPKEDLPTRMMFSTRAGSWLLRALAAHAPEQLISATLDAEGELSKDELAERTKEVFEDDERRRFVLELDATISRGGARRAGWENDLKQFAAIEDLGLEQVAAPSLMVQGSVDVDVVPAYSDHAVGTIPGAELLTLAGGTHLAFYTHPEAGAAQARALEFLR